jgi:hypothetical protein
MNGSGRVFFESQNCKGCSMAELQFFNSYRRIRFTADRLPRWQQEGALCFIIFRLADAVPRNLRTHWESEREAWFRIHPQLLRSWESFTSRKINSLVSGKGALWQRDYFDRVVRDQKHLANCVRYIRRNPERAGVRGGEFILYETELARGIA